MKATIVRKQRLTPEIHRYRLSAPQIAAAHKPAQYVSLRPIPLGDRICLTVTDANPENGWIDVVFHTGSKPASIFTGLREGDTVLDIVGPQGNPAPVRKYGNCLCVCSETGIAPLYPIIASLVKLKNRVTAVVGAHTKTDLILADELSALKSAVTFATEDGSFGRRGLVTDVLDGLIAPGTFDRAFVCGPPAMMKAVTALTEAAGIPTYASISPIIVFGSGICSDCRFLINGEPKSACKDGPEFETKGIDWDDLIRRVRSRSQL